MMIEDEIVICEEAIQRFYAEKISHPFLNCGDLSLRKIE